MINIKNGLMISYLVLGLNAFAQIKSSNFIEK